MTVPAALALHAVAPHGLVAWDQILEGPRERVVEPGPPVGRGRPLVEDEGPLLRPTSYGFLEGASPLPEAQDLLLEPREIYLRADLIESHAADLLTQKLQPLGRSDTPHRRDGSLGPRGTTLLARNLATRASLRRHGLPERTRCNGLARPVLLTV